MPILRLSTPWVFLLCFLITLAIRVRTDVSHPGDPRWGYPTDHHKYLYVAEHPLGSFHIQPACWRIGVPLAARVLPFSTYRNFDILSVLCLALSGCVLYLWLIAIPLSPAMGLLGVLMFYSLGGASKLLLWGVVSPDPASYFFILLALYATYRDNDILCALALLSGVFVKETVLLAGPLFYSLKAESLWDAPRFKRFLAVFAPAVCALVLIRILIPAWNDRDDYVRSLPGIYTQVFLGTPRYNLPNAFRGVMWTYAQLSVINRVRLFTYGSLGLHLFLPFFAPGTNRQLLLRWLPYSLPVVLSMLIAENPDRRVSSLFPMLIVLGLNGAVALAKTLHLTTNHFIVLFALILGVLLLKQNVLIAPFELEAVLFLGWLCYIVVGLRTNKASEPTALSI
jgi:hypothetical protein